MLGRSLVGCGYNWLVVWLCITLYYYDCLVVDLPLLKNDGVRQWEG